MTGLVDVRLLLLLPWLGALGVGLAPGRWSRVLGGVFAGATLLVAVLVMLAEPAGLAVRMPWVPALGLTLALGVGGLTAPGLLVTCLIGQVAALAPGGSRGSIAGGLALQGGVLGALLARDLGLIAGFHGLLAPIVVLLLMQGRAPERLRAALGAGFYLALGTGLLGLAAGALAVAHHDASGGVWSLELTALAQVLLPGRAEAAVGLALLLAGVVTLGLWPVHGWLLAAIATARPGTALLLAGPVRWLGVDLLLRLWLPLTPAAAAEQAPALAWVAVAGAVYGALVARAEPDGRRALGLVALVPAGLLVLGLAGQHHEGVLGAVMLALALTLGLAAGLLAGTDTAWARRVAPLGLLPLPGAIGLVGVALVIVGTARFAGLTLAAHAMWLALGAGLAVLLAFGALSERTGLSGHGEKDSREGGRGRMLGVAALLLPVVVAGLWPARTLRGSHASARAWSDMTARLRCERVVRAPQVPTLATEPSESCAQPLRTLAQRGDGSDSQARDVAGDSQALPEGGGP